MLFAAALGSLRTGESFFSTMASGSEPACAFLPGVASAQEQFFSDAEQSICVLR